MSETTVGWLDCYAERHMGAITPYARVVGRALAPVFRISLVAMAVFMVGALIPWHGAEPAVIRQPSLVLALVGCAAVDAGLLVVMNNPSLSHRRHVLGLKCWLLGGVLIAAALGWGRV